MSAYTTFRGMYGFLLVKMGGSGRKKTDRPIWCPLTEVTLQVSEPPADIATAVSAGDFFLSYAPLGVD